MLSGAFSIVWFSCQTRVLPLSKTLLRHHDFVFRLLSVFIASFKKDLTAQDNFFSIVFLRNDAVTRLGRDDISLTQI